MRALTSLSLVTLVVVASACVDNSGGPPPPGERVEHEPVFLESGGLSCLRFVDDADLIATAADVDAFQAECDGMSDAAETELRALVDALEGDDRLIIVSITLGGCIADTAIMGVYLDDTVAHVHVLRGDTSFGRGDVACTADIGELVEIIRVHGIADATSADVEIGTFNPDLPGAPALPG